jgi:hypothetical protein
MVTAQRSSGEVQRGAGEDRRRGLKRSWCRLGEDLSRWRRSVDGAAVMSRARARLEDA